MSFFTAYFDTNPTEFYIGIALCAIVTVLWAKDAIKDRIAKRKNKA